MGRKSKQKGIRGELEARNALRALGISSRRGRQYCGGQNSPDVLSDGLDGLAVLDGVHFEVKRTERLSLWPAVDQAEVDSGGAVPVVLHRCNRRSWLAIVPLDRLPELARRILEATDGRDRSEEPSEVDPPRDSRLSDGRSD